MKIAHFGILESEKSFFEEYFPKFTHLFYHKDLITPENIPNLKDIEILSVFVHTKVPAEIIDQLPRLKLIVTRSTGFDHIDIKYAKSKHIPVCNVPTYGENTVAEHAFALLLTLVKNLPEISRRNLTHNFSYKDLLGRDLQDLTVGIIGTGKIGLHAIRIARGFGMKVLAFDIFPNEFFERTLAFEYTGMDSILENSDIISIHVPYLPSTHHLIDHEAILKMKNGTILINTSRGAIVQNSALLEGLENGKISMAGLDVIEGEDESLENPLIQKIISRSDVLFTPHTAYYTKEATNRILQTTVDNIQHFLDHQINNQVNK
jgi:D-lactate dehydrogenase